MGLQPGNPVPGSCRGAEARVSAGEEAVARAVVAGRLGAGAVPRRGAPPLQAEASTGSSAATAATLPEQARRRAGWVRSVMDSSD